MAGSAGSGSGGTGYSRSARSRSTVRLVARIVDAGAAGQQLVEVAGGLDHLLQVVEDEQPAAVAELLDQGLQRRARPRQVGPHRPGDAGQDHAPARVTAASGTNTVPAVEAVAQPLADGQRQPGLADAARPGEGDQPHVGPLEQVGHLVDGLLPPDQRGRAHRQRHEGRDGRRRRRPRPRAGRRGRVAANRSLSSVARSSRTSRPSSAGVRKLRYESAASRLDAGEQVGEAGLAVGRRRLDVQQARQRPRQLELVLEPGDLHAGADLPVALPVQPDEDVALGQVGPVQLPRRVRPGAQLEQHRREPQRRDGARDRRAAPRPARRAWSSRTPAGAGQGSGSPLVGQPRAHGRVPVGAATRVRNGPGPNAAARRRAGHHRIQGGRARSRSLWARSVVTRVSRSAAAHQLTCVISWASSRPSAAKNAANAAPSEFLRSTAYRRNSSATSASGTWIWPTRGGGAHPHGLEPVDRRLGGAMVGGHAQQRAVRWDSVVSTPPKTGPARARGVRVRVGPPDPNV